MEPRAQRLLHPHRSGFPDQDEESGLERILGIVWIGEDMLANAQDHRSMALDQCRERQFRGLSAPGPKPLQELTVRQLPDRPQIKNGSDLSLDGALRSDRHELRSVQPVFTDPSS
jgi:hypothetical protein